jgi:hypothetical protein
LFIHTGSGGITKKYIEFATTKLGGSPASGKNETAWLRAFLENRYSWFANNKNPLIQKSSKRPKFFLDQLNAGNMNLDNL